MADQQREPTSNRFVRRMTRFETDPDYVAWPVRLFRWTRTRPVGLQVVLFAIFLCAIGLFVVALMYLQKYAEAWVG
jgi:hypothetical protein